MPPNPGQIFAVIVVFPIMAVVALAVWGQPYQWLIDLLPAIIKFGFVAALVAIFVGFIAGMANST